MVDISKALYSNGELKGLIIKEDDIEFPIYISSLHNPTILDGLLSSGWNLCGLPYDIRKGSLTIEMLPKGNWELQNFTLDDEQDMHDIDSILYPRADLRARLTEVEESYRFETPNILINTRQELLEFLERPVRKGSTDLMDFMPLNSFVNPAVLFSINEFWSKDNAKYRAAISERRKISLRQAYLLEKIFVDMGLKPDFKAQELVDFYFSWGFCGIRSDIKSKEISLVEYPIYDVSMSMNESGKIMAYKIGYVDINGNIKVNDPRRFRLDRTEEGNFREIDRRKRYMSGKNLSGYGKPIEPVRAMTPSRASVTMFTGKAESYEYTTETLVIKYGKLSLVNHTLQIENPFSYRGVLDSCYWNLFDTTEFYIDAKIWALSFQASDATRVPCHISSFNLLSKLGASPMSALKYLANFAQIFEESDDSSGNKESVKKIEPAIVVRNVEKIYSGDTEGISENELASYEAFIESALNGEFNVERIHSGIEADKTFNDDIYLALKVAYEYMGYTLEELYGEINKISTENTNVLLVKNGLVQRLPIYRKDDHKIGAAADELDYKNRMYTTAAHVFWVDRIYREPAPYGFKARHLAARLIVIPIVKWDDAIGTWVVDNPFTKLLDSISKTIMKYVDENLENQRNRIMECLNYIVISGLFEIANKGTLSTLKQFGGDIINFPRGTQESIRNRMFLATESLYTLTENFITYGGSFGWCCINATITPIAVIPEVGKTIKEYPFLPNWIRKPDVNLDILKTWVSKNWRDNIEEEGADLEYNNRPIVDHKAAKYNLRSYYELIQTAKADSDKTVMFEPIKCPLFFDYPDASDLYPELYYDNTEPLNTPRFRNGEIRQVTNEIICSEFPEVAEVCGYKVKNRIETSQKTEIGIKLNYRDLTASNINSLRILEDNNENCTNKVVGILDKEIILEDGKTIKFDDLKSYNIAGLPIVAISENKFLVEDYRGNITTVEV